MGITGLPAGLHSLLGGNLDLFKTQFEENLRKTAPLALRMRPETLDGFIGQEKIVGQGTALRKAILEDSLDSVIFWGAPGTGKTTLAKIISNITKAVFVQLSAVESSVKSLRKVLDEATQRLKIQGQKSILFIDEIHRFNKSQQDVLLPTVEEGIVTLIGATTENPYFEVNSPLMSRSRLFRFEPLEDEDMRVLVERAVTDKKNGLGQFKVELGRKALGHLIKASSGDARVTLNALEFAVSTCEPGKNETRKVTLELVEDAIQKKFLVYSKKGDAHYDVASAFIKSLRGSDPDAALYWLARMIQAGEDPKFIARRMIIAASEDIGLADSKALEVAVAAARAVDFVGLPEARINLAHAALYLAKAPKSNSVIRAIDKATQDSEREKSFEVPKHLRDSHYKGAKALGHGEGYKYPHNFSGHYVSQGYLPSELSKKDYYQPSGQGEDK